MKWSDNKETILKGVGSHVHQLHLLVPAANISKHMECEKFLLFTCLSTSV